MVGQGILICTADGSWSMPLPSCNPITCPYPGTNSHLIYADKPYGPGDVISVTCLYGYTLDGPSTLRCGVDGLWNTDLPICQAVTCPAPETEEEHLLLEVRQYRYTDEVHLSCDLGFQVDGHTTMVCQANGTWNGELPTCRQLQSADMMPSTQVAGLVSGFIVLFFAICIVLLIAIKRKKRKKKEHYPTGMETSYKRNNADTHSDISDDYDSFSDSFDEDIEIGLQAKARANTYYEFCPLSIAPDGTIPVDALGEFLNKDLRVEGYVASTFAKFKEGLQEPVTVANFPENKSKNRFKQVFPYDKTRVCLQREAGDTSDYINASYINGYEKIKQYVAAQGPNKATTNDFWEMIWQLGSTKIVMLTKLIEGGKVKCQQYWPNTGSEQFGSLTVTLDREEDLLTYIIRHIKIKNGNTTRCVTQFHYTDWPDQKVPSSASSLVQFFLKVEPLGQVLEAPIVVHCSAGIGRTGTYIALACLVQEASATGYVSVTRCVETLRRQRLNMVQTAKQFVFIHEALLEHLHGSTAIPVNVFRETFRQLHVEFDNLQKLSPKLPENAFVAGKKEENKNKNRYSNLLPVDKYRPLLSTPIDGHNDYINAVFLSDASKRVEYLITQMPLPHTVVDLWRLVYEQHITSIVMLNTEFDQQDDRIGVYWPRSEEQLNIGPFVVTEKSRATHHLTDIFTLSLQYKQEVETNVRQFRSRVWPASEVCPTSTLEFLRLLGLVREWQATQNGAVLVHCMNGLDKSGLFCVLDSTLQAADVTQIVDIQTTIKQMRRAQPKIIPNEKQYLFCYEAISMYLEQSRTYMNV
ncbi:receptor-type tyrosine-protein phosphatase kappa-like [Mizuhopecten yessoensis]|uniref:receptor-type tyrosine-protein phosphatase kappa-like n=1 Tax=Mizuhopecten yessoensis TaxID=6573 RepID=UPI000B4592DE|nr:receptor-type tyrosine-protein phosphatase kappa-like [Mizuhopecten yessoensis]